MEQYTINTTEMGWDVNAIITCNREPKNESEWMAVSNWAHEEFPLTVDYATGEEIEQPVQYGRYTFDEQQAFEALIDSVESWNGLEASYHSGTVQVFDNGDGRYELHYNQNRFHTQFAQFSEYVEDTDILIREMRKLNPDPSAWQHVEIAE